MTKPLQAQRPLDSDNDNSNDDSGNNNFNNNSSSDLIVYDHGNKNDFSHHNRTYDQVGNTFNGDIDDTTAHNNNNNADSSSNDYITYNPGSSTWDSRDNINSNNSLVLTYSPFLFDSNTANNHHSSNCGCGTKRNTNDNSSSWNLIYNPGGNHFSNNSSGGHVNNNPSTSNSSGADHCNANKGSSNNIHCYKLVQAMHLVLILEDKGCDHRPP